MIMMTRLMAMSKVTMVITIYVGHDGVNDDNDEYVDDNDYPNI